MKCTFEPSFHNVPLGRDTFIPSTCCSRLHAGFASVRHAVGSPLKEEKMKSKRLRAAGGQPNERGMEMGKCGEGQRGSGATGSEEGCG